MRAYSTMFSKWREAELLNRRAKYVWICNVLCDYATVLCITIAIGTGAIVGAVATAIGRQPDIICGKPYRTMFEVVQERIDVDAERTIMIGDRWVTIPNLASLLRLGCTRTLLTKIYGLS